jgi:hypothetical protein
VPEKRDCRITANLETTFQLLAQRVCSEEGVTISDYIRKLIIQDLDRRGKLTHELLLRLATTDSLEQIEQMVRVKANAAVA